MKDVFLPWYNALRLLVQSCDQLKFDKKVFFLYDEKRLYSSMSSNTNVMDTWIVSYTQTLLDFVKQEMDGKDLYIEKIKIIVVFYFSLSFIYGGTSSC